MSSMYTAGHRPADSRAAKTCAAIACRRNYRRTGFREVLRDPAFGCRERLGPLVNHAKTAAVDLALAQRNLPFVPLRGGPFGNQCREADDFIAAPRSEGVVVLLPGARLGLSLN